MSGNGNGNTGNNNNGGNGDGGSAESGPSLEQTLATTRGLLEAKLEAGVPPQQALEESRPLNQTS